MSLLLYENWYFNIGESQASETGSDAEITSSAHTSSLRAGCLNPPSRTTCELSGAESGTCRVLSRLQATAV